MTHVIYANANHEPILEPLTLKPRRRRLDRLVAIATEKLDVPFIVSVHKRGSILAPTDESVRIREIPSDWTDRDARRRAREQLQRRTFVGKKDIVLITVLPGRGGGAGGAGKIALVIASIALMAFAGPLAGAILGPGANAFALAALRAGITIGGAALIAAIARTNRPDTGQVYGVQGGGNIARKGGRIPVGYGSSFWDQPSLSQPDYFLYSGEDQTLFKRMTIGCGKYQLLEIRVGNTTLWESGPLSPNGGIVSTNITAPFPGTKFELLYGQASTLVPSDVLTSPSVSGLSIPLSTDVPTIAGPFAVSPSGTTVNKIQFDFSTTGYINKNGTAASQNLKFEYREIDDDGDPVGPGTWLVAHSRTYNYKTQKTQRWTEIIDVPEGRYEARAYNNVPELEGAQQTYTWDALRGYLPDQIVRTGITELGMQIKSGKGLSITSFADIYVRLKRLGPVWDGDSFVEGTLDKCVDIYGDMLTDTFYGGAIDASLVDFEKIYTDQQAHSESDRANGMIRGPVSLWDAAKSILANFRAEPIRIGSGFTYMRDQAAPAGFRRHQFTRSQMVRDSFEMVERPERDEGSAHYIVSYFVDTDPKRPDEVEVYYGDPSITPKRVEWPFLRTRDEATRIARWLAASGFYRSAGCTFQTEMMGRIVMRGDPIMVDPWFIDNRQVSAVVSAAGNTLTVDRALEVGVSYYATLRDKGGQEWGPVRVTQGANSKQVVLNADDVEDEEIASGLLLTEVIATGVGVPTSITIGPLADLSSAWLVQEMEPRDQGLTKIGAILDAPEVYTAIDEAITPDNPVSWPLVPSEAPNIRRFRVTGAQEENEIRANWSIDAEPGAVSYEVEMKYGAASESWEPVYTGPNSSGSHPVVYAPSTLIVLRARAFGSTGIPGEWEEHAGFIVTQPVVTAVVGPDVLDQTLIGTNSHFSSVISRLGERLDQLSEDLRSTDEQRQDGEERLKIGIRSTTAYSRASVVTLTQTIATETSALAALISALDAELTSAQGDILANSSAISALTADVSVIDGELSAVSSALIAVEASVGDISAGGTLKFVADVSPPSGATSGVQMLVEAADDGGFASAGLEAYAFAGGGGSPTGFVVLRGDRIYRRPAAGGDISLMVDDQGRFVGDAIGSGQVTLYKEYTRAEPGSDGAVGSGTTASNAGNSYIDSSSLGTLTVPENPDAIGDGATAADYCPVFFTVNATARNGPNGWNGGSFYPMVVAFRVKLDDGGGNVFYSDEGLISNYSSYSPSGGTIVYGFGGNPGTLADIAQVKAGTYNVYLQYRWGPRTDNGIVANPTAPNGLPLRIAAKIVALILKR